MFSPKAAAGAAVSLMVLVLLAATQPVLSEEAFQPRVFRVFDGDRFLVRQQGRTLRIRIQGVDAPELDQPHGLESKAILEKMISANRVTLSPSGTMDGGYMVAETRWQDFDIAAELVRVGAAWAIPGTESEGRQLEALQSEAREAGRGLWSMADPVPPWEWRTSDKSAGSTNGMEQRHQG